VAKERVELLSGGGRVVCVHDHLVHALRQKLGRLSDGDGGLEFVTGEHPHADAALENIVNGLGHVVLEGVLDGGGAKDVQVALHVLRQRLHSVLTAVKRSFGLVVLEGKVTIFLVAEGQVGDKQGPQALTREIGDGGVEQLQYVAIGVFGHALHDDIVGPLAEELDVALGGADDNGHSLAGGGEVNDLEDLEIFFLAKHAQGDTLGCSAREEDVIFAEGFKQGGLVWGITLIVNF